MKPSPDTHWHHLDTATLCQTLNTDPATGLPMQERAARQQEYGPNRLIARRGKSPLWLFLSQFHHPLIYILLGSGLVTGLLKGWLDAGVIFGVVLINAVIGFIQEMNALRAIAALAHALDIEATVLTAGQKTRLSARELVPGDVVMLQSGDKVPADLRLLKTRELRIDESALTGESVAVEKSTRSLPVDTLLADRSNLAFSSTLVTAGTGVGVVVATGERTEIGRINRLMSEATDLQTPLTRKIAQFSWWLMWFILGLAAITFAAGWWRGQPLVETFVASVALAVAAIPEGLPVAVTITLAIGVGRMARRNAIIRKLPAVETLGGTTLICSDKTGTLTQNQMTVQAIHVGGFDYAVTGSGYTPEGAFHDSEGQAIEPETVPVLMEILKAGLLCNDARLTAAPDHWEIQGDPTEAALLVVAHKAGLHHLTAMNGHPRIDAIPFESTHQFMATLHHDTAGDSHPIYLKGALEKLLARCDAAYDSQLNRVPLDSVAIHQAVERFTVRGLRVLAFVRGEHDQARHALAQHHIREGLSFIGLQAMLDPPRPEAIAAVARCRQAGIQVRMITGDHKGTAAAIARQVGLVDADQPLSVLDGRDLDECAPEHWMQRVADTTVFARVAPEQKLALVQSFQRQGHIVAMTGDGVNDAPALQQANIGVAMGITGTDVSKEAADMILTDDNFATIAAAVEEGRGVYDNLIKFITWTIPTNIGQGLVLMTAILAGIELPILPVQILWLNMTTAVLLGLPLALETREADIMRRPPRPPEQSMLTGQLLFRTVLVGLLLTLAAFGLFQWELMQGETLAKARTAAVNAFAIGQSFYLFNCRSLTRSMFRLGLFSNLWVYGGIAAMMLAQAAFIYLPVMNWVFHTEALGVDEWWLGAASGLLIYTVVGVEKFIQNRVGGRHGR
jgi:magnesium-transporting ATPase (P-type)